MTTTRPGTATVQHAPAGYERRSVEPAREAFVGAGHVTAVGTAAAGLVAAVVVATRLPGRGSRT